MALLTSRQSAIGLDIGKSSIVGVQLAGKAPSAVLKSFHERPIPEGLVFEGEVIDPQGLAAEIKGFMKESHMKGKDIHLGVGNQKVIVRNIEVPDMGEQELRGAIEFQAQDYIPIPMDEAVLDFQVVDRTTDEEGVAKQQVLLVAAQREMIGRYLEAAKKAGVRVAGIDVNAFALIRSLSPQVSFVDQGTDVAETFGIVNVSSSVSTLVVASNKIPRFTRIVNVAYDSFTQALMNRQGVPLEDALVLSEHIGLPGPIPADSETFNTATIADVQNSLGSVAEELGEEIRRSLDYYTSQDHDARVDLIILTGRAALVRNLDTYLSEFLNLTVKIGNPLAKIQKNVSGQSEEVLTAVAPRLAVAVGLAMDEVE
jgi:type IV pilus assembly protein PilM